MATVDVTFAGGEMLDRAKALLSGVEGGLDKALRDAQQRAASYLRSHSTAAIREQYAVSTANIRANQNVTVRYSYGRGLEAQVTFAGRKIPLYRYDGASPAQPSWDRSRWVKVPVKGKMTWVHPGLPAYGHQKRSTSPQLFQDAFVVRMKSGHVGIFERTGGMTSTGRDETREVMGSSSPQMLGNKEVSKKLTDDAAKVFMERFERNIPAILSGYWR